MKYYCQSCIIPTNNGYKVQEVESGKNCPNCGEIDWSDAFKERAKYGYYSFHDPTALMSYPVFARNFKRNM